MARQQAEERERSRREKEGRRRAEEEERRRRREGQISLDESEERRKQEEARTRARVEARRQAEEEAHRRAEEDVRLHAEAITREKSLQEEQRRADELAREKPQERARQKAEETARRQVLAQKQRELEAEKRRRVEAQKQLAREAARKEKERLAELSYLNGLKSEKNSQQQILQDLERTAIEQAGRLTSAEEDLRAAQERHLHALTAIEARKFVPPSRESLLARISTLQIDAGGETGAWKVVDAEGDSFIIQTKPDGTAKSTWGKGPNGFKGQTGTWRKIENIIQITWDDGSKYAVEATDTGYELVAYAGESITQRRGRDVSSATPVKPAEVAVWDVVFEDEFEGESLDDGKWNSEYPWTRLYNNELAGYSTDNVSVRDGRLFITANDYAVSYDGREMDFTGGVVTTHQKFEQAYGYFEIRCRVPEGRGLRPLISLISPNRSPAIDIFEILGHEPDRVFFNSAAAVTESTPSEQIASHKGVDFSRTFHTVGVKWTPEEVSYYIDGRALAQSIERVPREPMYLAASFAVGGDRPGPPSGWTPFPADFEIDYVRVFKRNEVWLERQEDELRERIAELEDLRRDEIERLTEQARIRHDREFEQLKGDEIRRYKSNRTQIEAEIAALRDSHQVSTAGITAARSRIDEIRGTIREEEKRLAQLARIRAEEEAKRRADEEAMRIAEEIARLAAEEEMRRRVEDEGSRIAAEEARREAEEKDRREAQLAQLKVEKDARRQAEEETRRIVQEEARLAAEEETRRRAEEETSRIAAEKAHLKEAEQRARREAQSAQIKAEEEARQRERIARENLEEERLRRPYEALEKESTVVAEPTIDSSALRQLIEEEESLRVLQDRLENNLDALTDSLALELDKRESEVRHHKAIMGDLSAKAARLRAAEISPETSPETELAADQELHPWRVWDADGDPFTILIVGDGRARSTWAKGSNGFKGQRGKWREEGETTVITWDDDTVFAIEPHGSKHVLTTQPTDEITGEIRRVVSEAAPIDMSEIELWEISFEDNFSGDTLDLAKWNTSFPWTQVINDELAGYSPTSVSLKDSNLTITAREEMIFYGGRTQPYTSGVLTTYRKFEQTYGYFELRCRISKAKGIWPAFWLFSTDHSAEIDVMDILGQKPDRVYFTLISKNAAGRPTKQNASHEGVDFSLAFHSVGVKWNPEAIVFYVDGHETASFTNNIPHKPMYLVTNLAVGGRWPGPPDGWTSFPIDFEVDFIRVFKRNEAFEEKRLGAGVLNRDAEIRLDQPYATTEIIGEEQIEEILSEELSRHETTLAELDEKIASLRITHRNTLAAIKTTRAQIVKTQKKSNREENRLKDL